MVCFVVLVVSGLVVYWIGETTTTPKASDHRPPTAQQPHQPHQPHETRGTSPATGRPTLSDEGGEGCGGRA